MIHVIARAGFEHRPALGGPAALSGHARQRRRQHRQTAIDGGNKKPEPHGAIIDRAERVCECCDSSMESSLD